MLGTASFGQDFITNLKNSVERSNGGSGAQVEYFIHLTPTTVKTYYAKDFDKGVLHGDEQNPISFELIKIEGEESQQILINLQGVAYCELEVDHPKGNPRYRYRFYY